MTPVSGSTIRPEREEDIAAIFEVERLAFGRDHEARLVDRLRDAAPARFISLVALEEGTLVGHILLTPVTIHAQEGKSRAMGLAPVAVNALDGRTGEVRYHPAFDAG